MRHMKEREYVCRDRWKDRGNSLWRIYTPVFTVSWLVV